MSTDFPKPGNQNQQSSAGNAENKFRSGIEATRQAADKTLDTASQKVDDLKSDVAPMLDKVSDQAQELMQRGREMLTDTTQKVRERASQVSDQAVAYTKNEPLKAMLIAAAAGAALMALVSLMARSDD